MTSSGLHTTIKTCLLLKRESDSSDSRFSLAKINRRSCELLRFFVSETRTFRHDRNYSCLSVKTYGFEQRNSPVGTGFAMGSHGLRRHDLDGLFVQLDQVS